MLKTIFMILGLVFVLTSIITFLVFVILKVANTSKNKKCSSQVLGAVTGYSMVDHNGVHPPIVEYEVDGMKYQKRYSVGLVVRKTGAMTKGQLSTITSNKITINTNQYFQSDLMHEKFPIGSKVPVYYNQRNPKQAYVGMIPKSIVQKVFLYISIGFMIIGIIPLFISLFL